MPKLTVVPQTLYADVNAVEKRATEWTDEVLACRTYGHNWQPLRAVYNARLHYYSVTQLCPRCTTERYMEIGERGQVYAQWYGYAEGYLSENLGRIVGEARGQLRMATIKRTFSLEKLSAADARETLPRSARTRGELGIEAV